MCMHAYLYVCMFVSLSVSVCLYACRETSMSLNLCVYACIYVDMYGGRYASVSQYAFM